MATWGQVRDGLKVRLDTISGLTVYARIPSITTGMSHEAYILGPIVGPGWEFDYEIENGPANLMELNFAVAVKVDESVRELAQEQLDQYLAPTGSLSIKAAIDGDPTLGGVANDTKVIEARDYDSRSGANVTFRVKVWLS